LSVEAELFEFVEQLADHSVVFDHAVRIRAETGLAFVLIFQVRPDVHPSGVPPQEERLVGLLRLLEVVERGLGHFLVNRLHALLAERAGALDF